MNPQLMQRIRDHITGAEKPIPHPYLDTNGNITIGIGANVNKWEQFKELPLIVPDPETGGRRPATEAEKRAGFDALRQEADKGGSGKRADKYKPSTNLEMSDADIQARREQDIAKSIDGVQKSIGKEAWNKLTDGQKTALVDVHFNRGHLPDGLTEAAKNGDADKMAEHMATPAGKKPDGTTNYNMDRVRANVAETLGKDPDSPKVRDAVERITGSPNRDGTGTKDWIVGEADGLPSLADLVDAETIDHSLYDASAFVTPGEDGWAHVSYDGGTGAETADALGGDGPDAGGGEGGGDNASANMSDRSAGGNEPITGEDGEDSRPKPDWRDRVLPGKPEDEKTYRPDIRYFLDNFDAGRQPIDDILAKRPEQWTWEELQQLSRYRDDLPDGDPDKRDLFDRETRWYDSIYGTDDIETDETGRMVRPTPIKPWPSAPIQAADAEGTPLAEARASIATAIADRAERGTLGDTAGALGSGLMLLDRTAGQREPKGPNLKLLEKVARQLGRPLLSDGRLAPVAHRALDDALAAHGATKVEDGLALGDFHQFARRAKQAGRADGLADVARDAVGPLFRDDDKPPASTLAAWTRAQKNSDDENEPAYDATPREESWSLQETLNQLGSEHFGEDWNDIAVDGWIGPETETAFVDVLDASGPDDLAERYGVNLGIL